MEKTWIPLLSIRHTVDRIVDLIIESVEHWKTVGIDLVGIDEVLRWLVEVPSARPHAPRAVEHGAPVGATVLSVVGFIVRVLNSEDRLDAIGILL